MTTSFQDIFQWQNCLFNEKGIVVVSCRHAVAGCRHGVARRSTPSTEDGDGHTPVLSREGGMDVTFLAHSGRKRNITQSKKGKHLETGQRSARDEHQASTTLVLDLTSVWSDWMPQRTRTRRTIESGAVAVCPNQMPSTKTKASRSHVDSKILA